MNQLDRVQQTKIAEDIINNVNRKLGKMYKQQAALEKAINDKKTPPEDRDACILAIEKLLPVIAAAEDRRRQMRRLIEELQHQALNAGVVELISTSARGARAQIVIHFTLDDDKKVSYTRHVHFQNGQWVGLSTVSSNRVIYHLHAAAQKAA